MTTSTCLEIPSIKITNRTGERGALTKSEALRCVLSVVGKVKTHHASVLTKIRISSSKQAILYILKTTCTPPLSFSKLAKRSPKSSMASNFCHTHCKCPWLRFSWPAGTCQLQKTRFTLPQRRCDLPFVCVCFFIIIILILFVILGSM